MINNNNKTFTREKLVLHYIYQMMYIVKSQQGLSCRELWW